MSGQGKQFEDLCSWVTDLTSLQNICIKKSLGTVQGMSLNAFAQAKVIGTVGGGNLYNFGIYVHQQFPQYNPQDCNETPGDQTTFRDLTDLLAPNSLQALVLAYVWATVGGQGTDPPLATPLTQLFSHASSWNAFTSSVETSNLDAVLGKSTTVMNGLALIYSNGRKTFTDLVTYLSTIQAVGGAAAS